ncbi:type 4b pilus protein PilO2 [Paraburkholderia sp. SARCC-3016]|uniref:type 4b pilus protein PilO2 n=1 Tax=Paraburkholderia sp. SARCC-3016 TaxID=3058611 RepID=UPI00280A1BB2|nr:type 4b pilus protein PilO2 [Paraburkholderia sp. SARCC-3016]MDQ7980287.1 type 4b pilus protein PilO2 [Paraburkholderia sp. SARCC-3016]
MAAQVIQLGRQRFVCGLFWQSLSRRHELRAEAVELAARLNFDAMVLRIDRAFAGAGFASTHEGAQLGLPSLGALVSKVIATEGAFYDGRQQPAPNWLAAFQLPDGRWAYFAVRDGAFLPNGDWVGASEEVFERLHSDYSLGGWNVVIGDPQLEVQGFHNFYARRIEDLLPRRGGKLHLPSWLNLTRAKRLSPWRTVVIATAAISVLGAAAIGVMAYRRHQIEKAREAAFEQARVRLRLRRPKPIAPPPKIVHPWASEPRPDTLIRACVSRFAAIAPGGWDLDEYVCRAMNVSYKWSRGGSNVAMLVAVEPHATIDSNGEHASYVEPMTLPSGGDDVIDGVTGVRLRMLSAFQLLDIPLTFSSLPVAVPQKSLASQSLDRLHSGESAAAQPSWRAWHLSARLGEVRPDSLIKYLDEVGVRIETLSYQSGRWTLDGVLYEK